MTTAAIDNNEPIIEIDRNKLSELLCKGMADCDFSAQANQLSLFE